MSRALAIGSFVLTGLLAGGVWWVHRRTNRQLGLAPPGKRARKLREKTFDPWEVEADKSRVASWMISRKADQVKELVPDALPSHIEPFAEYMVWMSKKDITGRDIVKAYLLTTSSIQRSAIGTSTVKKAWPTCPCPGRRVRPEDAMALLLQSGAGRKFLDAAAEGRYDKSAAQKLAKRFKPFGLEKNFATSLREAPKLARQSSKINRMLKKSRRGTWCKYVTKNVKGVSAAKAGFFASLLGRGDMATADARELEFWFCPQGEWNVERRSCAMAGFEGDIDCTFMDVFNDNMRRLKMVLPPKYRPFHNHLLHHALWDGLSRARTTHQEMIDAMRLAGS